MRSTFNAKEMERNTTQLNRQKVRERKIGKQNQAEAERLILHHVLSDQPLVYTVLNSNRG